MKWVSFMLWKRLFSSAITSTGLLLQTFYQAGCSASADFHGSVRAQHDAQGDGQHSCGHAMTRYIEKIEAYVPLVNCEEVKDIARE